MPFVRSRLALIGALLVALAVPARAGPGDKAIRRLGDEFLAHWLGQRPQIATRLGLHAYDDVLIPGSAAWF